MVTDDIYAQLLLAVAAREGPELPRDVRQIPERLTDPDSRTAWLLSQLYRHHPDTDLGLRYGHHLHPAALCDVARALCSAPTLGQTMGLVAQLAFARNQAFSLVQVESDTQVHVFMAFPHLPPVASGVQRFCIEAAFSFAVHTLLYSLGELPDGFTIRLPFSPPPYHTHYVSAWHTTPVFHSPVAALSFHSQALEWPLGTTDEALFAVSVERARQRWRPSLRQMRVSYRAAEAMLRHHPYLFQQDALASHLNVSTRTLQKQLSQEQDSFQALRHRVRRVLHDIYTGALGWSLADASEKLGFESLSGYRRFARTLNTAAAPGGPVRSAGVSTS
ncbi:MAG: AraC family transcriptional regulator [Gammaproteobacteria bacterium]|nr:MAG: AraC family transcriptional regulator [Gammaproteobacteria bacterium]